MKLPHVVVFTKLLMVVTCSSIFGCALLVPSSMTSFKVAAHIPSYVVVRCVRKAANDPVGEKVIKKIATIQGGWKLETAHFNNFNVTGFSMRVKYGKAVRVGEVTVRAIGIYYVDLGAEAMALKVKRKIIECAQNEAMAVDES